MSSNLKVNTILPSTGTAIGIGTAAGNIDILGHIVGHNTPNISGINSVTANHFYGDISNATGAAAGLGTALSQDQSNPLNKLYYTDRILSIGSTVTIDHPASATGAYTQYADILVEDNADLIVADGDDLIPDILGLGGNGTTGAGGAGRLLVDNIVNRSGTGAPSFPNGAVVTGVVTATSFSGDGSALTGVSSPTANRNFIINGAMRFWQRGTSFNSQGNGQNDYTTDRFAIGHNNSHMAAVTQQDGTGAHAKFAYCARVQRDSGNSQTEQMRFHTALETNDVILLRGEVLTISYYARKGANYSEANSKITGVRIATGENTDGDPNAYSGGHWTNATTILTGTPTLTTSWQRFSHTTSAVSNSANSMIIEFRHTPVGTAGANDYYEITGVQLEIGSSMTAFEHRRRADEFAHCQRYYQQYVNISAVGYVPNNSSRTYSHGFFFPVEMRAAPTLSITNTGSSNGQYITDGSTNRYVSSVLSQGAFTTHMSVSFNISGDLTDYRGAYLFGTGNTTYQTTYKIDAEL